MPKIKSLIWYIRNPKYWNHAIRVLKAKNSRIENSRIEAQAWASSKAITNLEFFKKVGLSFHSFEEENKEQYEIALKKAKEIIFNMGGAGNLDLLYSIVKNCKPNKVIETGVSYGWSSFCIMKAFKSNEQKLISTDMPYVGMGNEDLVGIVVPEKLKASWQLIREEDKKGLPIALRQFEGNIDLCHYDSDKSYQGRMFAYPILYNALCEKGWFISDDIGDNVAFRDFCILNNISPFVINDNGRFVGLFVK